MRILSIVLAVVACAVLEAARADGQPYSVSFGGRPLRLETARISAMPFNRIWNGTQRPPEQTRPAAFVQLDVAAPGELCVTFDGEAPAAEVYPLSESARAVRAGRAWRVPLDGPGYRVLDFGADVPPLHVFANEPFAYRHVPGEIYFGPGEHDAGVIAPTNGQTVCLDAGAVVRGALFVDRATNVTVVGRGILDCSGFTRADPRAKAFRRGRGLPEEDTEFACHACVVYASRNVRLSGIVIRDTPFWALIVRNGSRDVVIDGVKVIGQWRYNSDGIDVAASEDVTVRNSFMRTFDDCAVVLDGYLDPDASWSRNVLFERCFMWCDWGANIKVWGGAKAGGVTDVCFRSNVLAHVSGRACAINGAYSSPSTVVRNIAVEDLEIDVRARPREQVQRSDADAYAGGFQDELQVFSVAVPWPRKNLGNQHSRPLTEAEAATCSKRFENIAFRRFAVLGDPTALAGAVKVDGPNQSVGGITTEDLPPLRLEGTLSAGAPRIAFVGDSITHDGRYLGFVQLAETLADPGNRAQYLNLGICGDTTASVLRRWQRIVDARPTDVVVMLGMNDVGVGRYCANPKPGDLETRAASLADYALNLREIVRKAKLLTPSVRLMTPSPYDEYGDWQTGGARYVGADSEGLAACAKSVRAIAREEGVPFAEVHEPFALAVRGNPGLPLGGRDRVHPVDGGHLVMAACVVRSRRGTDGEMPPTVWDAAQGLSFDYRPARLGFPRVKGMDELDRATDLGKVLGRERLVVTNLAEGTYRLLADGRPVGSFTAAELASGLDLQKLDTPSARRAREAARIAARYSQAQADLQYVALVDGMIAKYGSTDAWILATKSNATNVAWSRHYAKHKPLVADLRSECETLSAKLSAACRPVACRFELKPCGGTDPATRAAWIWKEGPGAFRLFRNRFVSDGTPARIRVSADMRYVLRLDGRRICRGPERGEVGSWTYRTLDLDLPKGEHVLEAVVRHGGNPPLAQTSSRAGFILSAEGAYDAKLTTGKGGWRVATVGDVTFAGETGGAFGAGLPDVVRGTAPEFAQPPESAFAEPEVVRAPHPVSPFCHTLPGWKLVETTLPRQMDRPFPLPGFSPMTVPAQTTREITCDLGGYFCVYPEIAVTGGKGAEIRVSWAENRDKLAQGFTDTFLPDGGENRFGTSWFRPGRFCRLAVKTADEPLELREATLFETRYPLDVTGLFSADDESLARIGALCRRGLELCSHETTFDCPYYEQLQYLGDSRVQFFAHFALTDDDRLMKRAVEIFELSRRADGLMPMNAPIEGPASESPTYTMCYPLILADYARFRADRDWLVRRLPGLAHVMEGLAACENADGLLENLPGWCFIDWTKWAKSETPGAGPEAGRLSACENLLYLLALESAAEVETACGDRALAERYRARAARAKAALLRVFWSEEKGAIADDPERTRFSEHALALSVLADALDLAQRARTRKVLLEDGSLTRASVYFSHYVFSAYFRLDAADAFLKRLDLWRDYLKDGYLTPLEMPAPTRSECHAWGSHPSYHFAAGLAGISPAAPFFGRVRVAPQPGTLGRIDCTMPHPRGRISVSLRFDGTRAEGQVTLPDGIDGEFAWRGRTFALHGGRNEVKAGDEAAAVPRCPTWINVTPLLADHLDEIAADNRWLFENTLVDGAAFKLTLTPEGDPAFDKASVYAPLFRRVQGLLKGAKGKCGVVFQATIGHGWTPDSRTPGQKFVGRDGNESYIFCPLGDGFLAYLRDQTDKIAATHPDFFMIDDDTRLITGRDGCFCPLHLAEMARRTGRTFTRESLVAALAEEPGLARTYDKLLEDSIVRVVKTVREAFDRVDPLIPGSFCCCCGDVRHASRLARLAAAKGQRPVLRLNNGRYCLETARDIPDWLHKTSLQLKTIDPDVTVLDEPDTCPQNRYSMSAKDLHAHVALALLEGCRGGKLWVTRMGSWEPASGVAYRRTLQENSGFYRALVDLGVRMEGVRCPLPAEPYFALTTRWHTLSWGSAAFGRMGIPYANEKATLPLAAFSGDEAPLLSDEDLRTLLAGRLLVDGSGALELTRRGFAEFLGAKAEPWSGPVASFERLNDGTRINSKIDAVRFRAVDPKAERLSALMHRSAALSDDATEVGVGAYRFRNALGGEVIALADRLPDRVNLFAFHFYNEVRKRQVVSYLKMLGLDAPHYPGDGEVLLRWGRAKDGARILAACVTGHDGLDNLPLVFPGAAPSVAEILNSDGAWTPVRIRREGETTVFDAHLGFLEPVVFRLP